MDRLSRREVIQQIGAGALAIGSAAAIGGYENLLSIPAVAASAKNSGQQLRFGQDGSFKLQVLCDLHYNVDEDTHSFKMISQWLDAEKPDLVIVAGDCIAMSESATTPDQAKAAIECVGRCMEERKIPWGITFGNHDAEQSASSGMGKDRMIDVYSSFAFNINKNWRKEISGIGNQHILIWDSDGKKPQHCVWLLDSGDRMIPGKEYQMHADQVEWYYNTSLELERKYKGKIPGTMLFHIPIPEYAELARTKKIVGIRDENECPPAVNSGILAAAIDRGDIKAICCGHDHVNNYLGNWRGVHLSYAGVSGFHGYPTEHAPDDPANDKCRCCRVFVFNEADPWSFKTWIRFKDNTIREDLPQPDASV